MASTTLSTTITARMASTSSLVTEVLTTAVRLEKEDLDAKLGKLSKRTEEVKVKVYNALEEKYVDFYPNLNTAEELTGKVKNTLEEMQQVADKVDKEIKSQLSTSTAEFQDLSTQLTESSTILAVLDKLAKVYNHLQSVDTAIKASEYTSAVSSLQAVHQLLDKKSISREREVKIFAGLQRDYLLREEKLRNDISEMWSQCVVWDISKQDGSSKDKTRRVALSISSEEKLKALLPDIVQALYNMGDLTAKLQLLGDRFLEHFVTAVLQDEDASIKLKPSSLGVEFKQIGLVSPVTPRIALENLRKMLGHLNSNLLGLSVSVKEDGIDENRKLIQLLGDCISASMLEKVCRDCLAHSVPSNHRQLETYRTDVVQHTKTIHDTLIQMQFIGKNNTVLLDFVNNINVMFANKKTQEILKKARGLMSSDIHNMVKISADLPLGDLPPLGLDGASAKRIKSADIVSKSVSSQLSGSTFKLPACYISWTQELMQLAYETLHEATESSPQCAIQLFYTVRNIFELYCSVVPTYHREALITVPQISALHHNNCLYTAHHLLTLGHQYRPQLPQPLEDGQATFLDLVPKLRRLGTDCLLQQMVRQRDQLLDCLNSAQGFINISEDDNFQRGERAVKQTLHQLHHLSNVWRPVLPHSVYCKTLGTLLNSAILELTTCIITLEDISADDATQLCTLLSVITAKAPELFTMEGSEEGRDASSPVVLLYKHVAKWAKLTELMLVLNASLQDIADRWADGKGPLAAEFGVNELKQLTRALFQNTARRAAVLAKIK